ncbi:MAG: twin-arginine translocase TatA/TatE family subunit [Parvibaculaceae bacterium]|nr:twin-arginine translocase TatA/TatE family subunit [Parvibaculaceae bacterium]
MGSIGPWQIIIVVVLIVLLFGRGKISELMGDVAKGVTSFRKGLREEVEEPKNIEKSDTAEVADEEQSKDKTS